MMNGRYEAFDQSRVRLRSLSQRINDLSGNFILPLQSLSERPVDSALDSIASAIIEARQNGNNTVLFC